MAPWIEPTTTSWGVRRNLRTVRSATAVVAARKPAPRSEVGAVGGLAMVVAVAVIGFLLSGCDRRSGEGEEDLVEGRAAQRDVVDGDAAVVQQAHGLHEAVGAGVDRDRQSAGGAVDVGFGHAETVEHTRCARQLLVVACVDLDDVVARSGLELVGGPVGDDPAVVDDHDAAGQVVGLVEVLGRQQDVGTTGGERPDGVPQLDAARGVEAGGRLVEQQQPGRADEAGAEVEPAAHAARVRPHQAVGGVGEAEVVEHGGGRGSGLGAGRPVEAGDHLQVLPAGHGLFDGGVLAGEPDQAPHLTAVGGDVVAGDAQGAGVGPQQGGDAVHEGGLAGAVGAEQADNLPGLDHEVQPGERLLLAESLREASGFDERRHGNSLFSINVRVVSNSVLYRYSDRVKRSAVDETNDTPAPVEPPWWRPAKSGTRTKQPLSRDAIIDAAIKVLDAEGVDALTIRRLADELGTGPATLYWHIKGKDELGELV